jgi:hypothetical protein
MTRYRDDMEWLRDPTDERVQKALGWTCDLCQARVKHLCVNTIRPGEPLPGRVVHHARLVDRRRQKPE